MAAKALSGLDPLKDLLTDVIARLEALENKVGCGLGSGLMGSGSHHVSSSVRAPKSPVTAKAVKVVVAGEVPAVKAYDAYVKSTLVPLAGSCDDLNMGKMGDYLKNAWEGIRTVIVLASRSKQPSEGELSEILAPHLEPTQQAVKAIRDLKLDRDLDRHQKAISEMLTCLSWVLLRAPKALPVAMVKETLGSAEFWSNRIRKDFKDKDDRHIGFCDNIKLVITGLAEYIEEYHKTGLSFNPKGISLAEAAIRLSDPGENEEIKSPQRGRRTSMRHPMIGSSVVGGNIAGLMGELSLRQSEDGSSAATGLKKVTKDQQTWRKEFKKPDGEAAPVLPPPPPLEVIKKKEAKKKPLRGLPILEYQDRGFKWIVENHTSETVAKELSKSVIEIDITDSKQQVYIYNCDGVTIKITGKFKSLCLDKCNECALIFDSLISNAEIVNCKKIKIQVNDVCPVFTIDKTNNILVWLSTKECLDLTKFTTSLSSEMNVSFPDGDDQKELPIPEQFVHRLMANGRMASEVSDLYH